MANRIITFLQNVPFLSVGRTHRSKPGRGAHGRLDSDSENEIEKKEEE